MNTLDDPRDRRFVNSMMRRRGHTAQQERGIHYDNEESGINLLIEEPKRIRGQGNIPTKGKKKGKKVKKVNVKPYKVSDEVIHPRKSGNTSNRVPVEALPAPPSDSDTESEGEIDIEMEGGAFTGGAKKMYDLGKQYGEAIKKHDKEFMKHGGDFWKDFKRGFKKGLETTGKIAQYGHYVPNSVGQAVGFAGDIATGIASLIGDGKAVPKTFINRVKKLKDGKAFSEKELELFKKQLKKYNIKQTDLNKLIKGGAVTGGKCDCEGDGKMTDDFYDGKAGVKVVGKGRSVGAGKKKGNSKAKQRGALIKKIMKERGVKLGEASKIIKGEGLM